MQLVLTFSSFVFLVRENYFSICRKSRKLKENTKSVSICFLKHVSTTSNVRFFQLSLFSFTIPGMKKKTALDCQLVAFQSGMLG